MKHLWLIALFSLLQISGQTWQETNITPNSNGQRFDDVFFLNDNLGWAANGFYAAVYKTEDGGLNWTEQLSNADLPGNYYFRNIEFIDENIGFLGTLNDAFFKTTDGGSTWQEVTNITPNPNAICGLDAVGNSTIYGCGAFFSPACIIKSTDGGDTWSYLDMSTYADALVEVLFVDESLGYASGKASSGACILKTTDGGTTWQEIYNSGISGEFVWKLQFINDNPNTIYGSLYSVANNPGKLVKSFDAGVSWSSLDAPETSVQAVGFINESTGWMGGHNTGFYETNDGGVSWSNINFGGNLNRIFILSESLAYATGTSVYKFSQESLSTTEEEQYIDGLDIVTITKNPVENLLHLRLQKNAGDNIILDLYDINGKLISNLKRDIGISTSQSVKYQFDVSHLSSGTYFLNLHNNLGQKSIKFIKN